MTHEGQDHQYQQCRSLNLRGHNIQLLRVGDADGYAFFLTVDGAVYGSAYSSQVNALEAAYRLIEVTGFRRAG